MAIDSKIDFLREAETALATNLSRHGMQIQEVAAILGHEKLDTTMKYVVLNKDEIRNSYRRYT